MLVKGNADVRPVLAYVSMFTSYTLSGVDNYIYCLDTTDSFFIPTLSPAIYPIHWFMFGEYWPNNSFRYDGWGHIMLIQEVRKFRSHPSQAHKLRFLDVSYRYPSLFMKSSSLWKSVTIIFWFSGKIFNDVFWGYIIFLFIICIFSSLKDNCVFLVAWSLLFWCIRAVESLFSELMKIRKSVLCNFTHSEGVYFEPALHDILSRNQTEGYHLLVFFNQEYD